ncbi:MAG: HDIG domain-containing protein [Anaerolineae bacterium]|nr:HDIG domain-containing protein [Anaerolineae bacterium]
MDSKEQVPETRSERFQRWLHAVAQGLLVLVFILGGAAIIAWDVLVPSSKTVALQEGQVAPRDLLAPRSLKYESAVLSQAKRDAEIAAVRPVYDPPDPGMGSEQTQRARLVLDFIENIRYDDFATPDQKRQDIEAITDLSLSPAVIEAILSIEDDSRWRAIDAQVMRLLERVMSGEIREDNIQAKKDELPNLISASYSEIEVQIVTGIVSDLLKVNTFYNEELTREAQAQAAQNVPVEVRTFARGQMIIRAGEIATTAHIEALEQFSLLRITEHRVDRFVGGVLAMGLVTALLGMYIWQFYPKIFADAAFMLLLGLLLLLFLGGAQVVSSSDRTQPYYYPAAALAFLVATLVSPQLAIVVNALLAVLAGFLTNSSLEFALLISFSGTLGVLSLGRTERLNAYFVAGMVVIVSGIGVSLMFTFGTDESPTLFTVASQIFGSVINGLLSAALALVGLYVISNILNIPTSLKIVELLQPNHPLLQRLLREAPGTYQHSLQVANLAEQGAQQVGANTSLLRVAAMYHDVGKMLNPHFFVENQADGVNPHDLLGDPSQSARIIIGHVTEGGRLARRYRLPLRIRDFIMEHHGTTQVMYFYREALKQAEQTGEQVDLADFTYPGPIPQSRETAILMLADGCESSVRARRPQSKDDIRETVDYIFETRLQGGQLDESGLTLNELRLLRDTFLTALKGVFHPRIAYPGTPGQKTEALPSGEPAALPSGDGQPEKQAGEHTAKRADSQAKPQDEVAGKSKPDAGHPAAGAAGVTAGDKS